MSALLDQVRALVDEARRVFAERPGADVVADIAHRPDEPPRVAPSRAREPAAPDDPDD